MSFLKRLNPFSRKGVEEVSTPFGKVIGWRIMGGSGYSGDLAELQSAALFACVQVLCNSASILPVKIHQQNDNSQTDFNSDPLWKVINRKPNPFQIPAVFKAQMMLHLLLKGNYYGWINRVNGKVVSVIPMHPDYVETKLDAFYQKSFVFSRPGGARVELSSADVLHIPGLVFDGSLGLAIKDVASKIVSVDLALQDHSRTFFENQAVPGQVVLKTAANLKPEQALKAKEDFEKSYTGANKHKMLFLYGGLDVSTLTTTAVDSQLIQQKQQAAIEICGVMGVPPHMIGIMGQATYNNVENLGIVFVTYGMLPKLVRIEEALGLACLGEDSEFYCKFNVDALLRGDSKSQAEILNIERNAGVISANEWRAYKGRAPVEGGDTYVQPLNMGPLGAPPAPAPVKV